MTFSCLRMGGVHFYSIQPEVRGQLAELFSPSTAWVIIRSGGKCFYPLSYLIGSRLALNSLQSSGSYLLSAGLAGVRHHTTLLGHTTETQRS